MKLRDKCDACKKTKFFVRKRSYYVTKGNLGKITSKGVLCKKCYKNILKMI